MKSYITVILISALLLSTLFFALPKTENFLPFDGKRFDLNKKEEQYWKKDFILELNILPKDRTIKDQLVEKTKDTLYKRLRKIGVEEIQIVNYEANPEDFEDAFRPETEENYINEYLKVTVQTSRNPEFVASLITNPGVVKIMLPKSDIENDEDDPLKLYMEENYEETEWTRERFRTILINDLQTGDGEKNYFAIFKPKFTARSAFTKFLREHEGETVGIFIGGFVRPLEVQEQSIKVFATALTPDQSEAQLYDILFNTGTVPVDFKVVESNELKPKLYDVDYVQITLAILVSIISLLAFLYQREKEEKEKILQLAFSLLLLFSISFTMLKIWQIPVDLFLLIPTAILATIFMKTMYTCSDENKAILTLSTIIAVFMTIFGTGYIPILGRFLLFVILLSFLTEILTKVYFKHIKILNE